MIRGVVVMAALAGPAAAETLFSPPAGCEVFVTVQNADCTAEHMMRCDGQAGVTSVTLYADGGDYVLTVDDEAQWVFSYDDYDGTTETLVEPQTDPSLLSDLLRDRRHTYDFTTEGSDGAITRFVGKEAVVGDEVTIDGVTLLQTRNEMQAFAGDGTWLWSVVSQEYLHPEWRVWVGGTSMWNTPTDGEYPSDSSPVEFVFPGEPGFLSTVPAYGCAG